MVLLQHDTLDDPARREDRLTAAGFVHEAFAESLVAGVDSRSFAECAIAIALEELVARYGEDAVAAFAGKLPGRIHAGEFSMIVTH